MASKKISDQLVIEAIMAVEKFGSPAEAAKELKIPDSTIRWRILKAEKRGFIKNGKISVIDPNSKSFEMDELPDPEAPVEEIIKQAIQTFTRRSKAAKARDWFNIKMKVDGPFAIASFGDPHLDDNGCNWPILLRDVEIVKNTEYMWGLGLGDYTNNWAGRLVRLYAEQEMTRSKALRVAE